jgi:hypothetical protein
MNKKSEKTESMPTVVARHNAYDGEHPFIQCVTSPAACGCQIIGNGTCPHPLEIQFCRKHSSTADLIEACKLLVAYWDRTASPVDKIQVKAQFYEMARAAVAKAEGNS